MAFQLPEQANNQSKVAAAQAGEQPSIQQKATMSNNAGQQILQQLSLRNNRGIGRSSTSEPMRKVLEQLDKIVASEPADSLISYKFVPLSDEKLNISALVVVGTLKNPTAEQKHAMFHTLLLAGTSRGIKSREMKVEGTSVTYEHLVLPTDGMDATMVKTITESLANIYPGYKLHSAEWTVIPTTLNLDSEEAVRNIASNATTAVWTLLASEIGGAGWVIERDFKGTKSQLAIKYSDNHFTGLDGLPVRSDVVLELSEIVGRTGNQQDWQFNGGESADTLMQINGFFDLTYDPAVAQSNNVYGSQPVATAANQLLTYKPRFVVTNVDSPEACDLTLQLLGLATTQVLPLGNHHVACLIEQHRAGERNMEGGVNLRDIGAIGLEVLRMASSIPGTPAPATERFPTLSANLGDDALAAIINTYISGPDTQISLDVPEGGPSTWMTAVFAAAARGDSSAKNEIFAAADVLTGNRFTPIYTAACGGRMDNPVFDDNLIVNLGTYISKNSLRDIRDLDYLAVLNLTGDSTSEVIINWSNLQANYSMDENFRAMEARKVLQNAYKSLQFTGRARRVTFNNLFLQCLLAAIKEAGMTYNVTSSKQAPTGSGRMVNSYMAQQARFSGQSGAFTTGGGNRPNAAVNAPGSFGRYSFQSQNNFGGGNY